MIISIKYLESVSAKTNKPYKYVALFADGVEFMRFFPKPTEVAFYLNLVGDYSTKVIK